jgi:uncharacterized C2H2 Zn-finger protein
MQLRCERCDSVFDSDTFVGYCPECVTWFREGRKVAHDKANPAPGLHLTGKFNEADRCPQTVMNPIDGKHVCGLCGSKSIESGYGFAGGFGLGVYQFCEACNAVLDFSEDTGE